jgi:hypothetical protein
MDYDECIHEKSRILLEKVEFSLNYRMSKIYKIYTIKRLFRKSGRQFAVQAARLRRKTGSFMQGIFHKDQ